MTTYHSPRKVLENVVSFNCSNDAAHVMVKLLRLLSEFGSIGHSVTIKVEDRLYGFDGDGEAKLGFIKVNGLSLDEWNDEFTRLERVRSGASEWGEPQQDIKENEA